jgi:hypothetical protein
MKYVGQVILNNEKNLASLAIAKLNHFARQESDEAENSAFYIVAYYYVYYEEYYIDTQEEKTAFNYKPTKDLNEEEALVYDDELYTTLMAAYHGVIRKLFK